MAGERSGTRKSKRVAAMEIRKPRKSPKTISLSDLPKKSERNKRPKAAGKSVSEPKHPTYFQMVVEAIVTLKERAGSSRQAIAKFIGQSYRENLPEHFRRLLNNQLRSLTEKGRLIQVRGSFKLPEDVKNSKEVKELKKTAHVTAGAPKKAEKKKAEVAKAKRAKPAAKPPVGAKKNVPVAGKRKPTPRKVVSVKKERVSTGKKSSEVTGSNPASATRKSQRVTKSVAVGPRGRK